MPLYDYRCKKCSKTFELQHKISDVSDKKCPDCESLLSKEISSVSFQLKGSGWYKTDYNKSNKES